MLLAREADGSVSSDWISRMTLATPKRAGRFSAAYGISTPVDRNGRHLHYDVIGTIEVGDEQVTEPIAPARILAIAKAAATTALKIHETRLSHVLELVTQHVRQMVGASCATLHFDERLSGRGYHYNVASGELGWRIVRIMDKFPPRRVGLGRRATKTGHAVCVPDDVQRHRSDKLRSTNRKAWDMGLRAMAAAPLPLDTRGTLYVGTDRPHYFNIEERRLIEFFANWASDFILFSMKFAEIRDQARQLETLQAVVGWLVREPNDPTLLDRIVCITAGLFGADIVTLYEYTEATDWFDVLQTVAGRSREPEKLGTKVDENATPRLLVRGGANIYADVSAKNAILNPKPLSGVTRRHPRSFVKRERICSSAGVLLRADSDQEIVGTMFINYRRPHRFLASEKAMIETMASAAAIAIKNRRVQSVTGTGMVIGVPEHARQALGQLVRRVAVGCAARSVRLWLKNQILGADRLLAAYPPGEQSESALPPPGSLSEEIASVQPAESVLLWVTRSPQSPRFTVQDQQLLRNFAAHAVISLERQHHHWRLEAARRVALGNFRASDLSHTFGGRLFGIENQAKITSKRGLRGDVGYEIRLILKKATELRVEVEKAGKKRPSMRADGAEGNSHKSVALSGMLDALLEKMSAQIGDIEVVRDLPVTLPPLEADGERLSTAVENIILNATQAIACARLQASSKGHATACPTKCIPKAASSGRRAHNRSHSYGRITVSAELVDVNDVKWVRLSISDNGRGLPNDIEFDGSRGKIGEDGHTGFGLYTTRYHVSEMGGQILWRNATMCEGAEVILGFRAAR
jgi:GAF domain-containing protein